MYWNFKLFMKNYLIVGGSGFLGSHVTNELLNKNAQVSVSDIIGPQGNYSTLPNGAKWILSVTMLIGRLEIFTILVLFSFNFWKK